MFGVSEWRRGIMKRYETELAEAGLANTTWYELRRHHGEHPVVQKMERNDNDAFKDYKRRMKEWIDQYPDEEKLLQAKRDYQHVTNVARLHKRPREEETDAERIDRVDKYRHAVLRRHKVRISLRTLGARSC